MSEIKVFERENERLNEAIKFAVDAHAGQLRKGSETPYIVHPLEVLGILYRMGADTDLLIAGVLHDTIEDTDATEQDIRERFGDDVAALVCGHSEDKSKSWDERKRHTIEELRGADRRMKMLVMADKLSNLRSMHADYLALGDKLWSRFNAPMYKQSWYYSEIIGAVDDMRFDLEAEQVFWEMNARYKDVFVRFYRSFDISGENYLVQLSAHGEAYRFDRGNPIWRPVNDFDPEFEDVERIDRIEAERTAERWYEPFGEQIESDLHAKTYELLDAPECFAELKMMNCVLTLEGEYYSDTTEKFRIVIDEYNTRELLTRLRAKYGLERELEELLHVVFGGMRPTESLFAWCVANGVRYEVCEVE